MDGRKIRGEWVVLKISIKIRWSEIKKIKGIVPFNYLLF
jgi:hypothetical protein